MKWIVFALCFFVEVQVRATPVIEWPRGCSTGQDLCVQQFSAKSRYENQEKGIHITSHRPFSIAEESDTLRVLDGNVLLTADRSVKLTTPYGRLVLEKGLYAVESDGHRVRFTIFLGLASLFRGAIGTLIVTPGNELMLEPLSSDQAPLPSAWPYPLKERVSELVLLEPTIAKTQITTLSKLWGINVLKASARSEEIVARDIAAQKAREAAETDRQQKILREAHAIRKLFYEKNHLGPLKQ